TRWPLAKRAPARTRATRWGAFTARHRAWVASTSLNTIARPAAREPDVGQLIRARLAGGWEDVALAADPATSCGISRIRSTGCRNVLTVPLTRRSASSQTRPMSDAW